MSELFGSDAFAPRKVAQRLESVGATKARMPTVPLLLLGVLAGAFIGLVSLFFFIFKSDATVGLASSQELGRVGQVSAARHCTCCATACRWGAPPT